jgi:hypothetical protein
LRVIPWKICLAFPDIEFPLFPGLVVLINGRTGGEERL